MMHNPNPTPRRTRRGTSRQRPVGMTRPVGFTLVEMLVAVALVLLLMSLFAQVFQIAGSSVSTQRGIMENDQRARSVQTLLKGDLDKRTFRYLVPFAVNEDLTSSGAKLAQRKGYFYIAENNVGSEIDDVLAFTVDARVVNDSADQSTFYGRSVTLGSAAFLRSNLNQPEGDDARLDPNLTSESPAAEVVYFLRGGNLYRRVLLIRNASSRFDEDQPETTTGFKFFSPNDDDGSTPPKYLGAVGGTSFWRDFDFSAHPRIGNDGSGSVPPVFEYDGAEFNTTASLIMPLTTPRYSRAGEGADFTLPLAIAYPPNRFGHDGVNPSPLTSSPSDPPTGGQPREFGTGGWFVGRPLIQESAFFAAANIKFSYPHLTHNPPAGPTDNLNQMNVGFDWNDSNSNGIIDAFDDTERRGEDLVMTNVHSFDVKVYDEILGRYVDLGHQLQQSGVDGDFHEDRRRNSVYGALESLGADSQVFDTWYPFSTEDVNADNSIDNEDTNNNGVIDGGETDTDGDGLADQTEDRNGDGAFTEQRLDFDGDGSITSGDFDGDGIIDFGENFAPYRPLRALPVVSSGGYVDYERWIPNTGLTDASRYVLGNRVFPQATPQGARYGDPFYYVVVAETDKLLPLDGVISHGTTPPSWPEIDGVKFDDGEITWQAVDNRKPLRGIQITIRFLDRTTQQLRTLTIQQGLVDSDQ